MINKKVKVNTGWQAPGIFMFLVFLFLGIIILQLVYVCLFPSIYGINMKKLAASRNTYERTLYAKRGTIFDSEGNALALNVSSYTVIAYLSPSRTGSSTIPKHVVDVHKTAEALSPLINMTVEKLTELLTKDAYQVELGPGGRGITELVKKQIEDLNLPGIDFIENYKRYYPNGDFASYILGYAKNYEVTDEDGTTSNEIVGELGIESKYNKLLLGTNGYLSYQRDRYGYKIPDTKEFREEAINGADIYLTIDSNIQRFAEAAMRTVESKYSPVWGVITVMDAKDGSILAASSIPTFDPNIKNITNYQSPFVTYTYEPGSTMKTYSYACAIEAGKYDGNIQVKTGSIIIGDDEVRDWNRTGWGTISLDRGFVYSSNVAASVIVQDLITKSELKDCLTKFGFGKTTGIELSNESSGDISFTYPIEVATASFGQGITTTVVQQLQGMTMFANDGSIVKPRIVDKIVNPNTKEVIYQSEVVKSKQLIKQDTITYMKKLMYDVVNSSDSYGTAGWRYRTTGFTLIGKTGTAQIASNRGGYLQGDNDYIYSFAGLFPYENPEVVIYVAIQQPKWGNVHIALSDAIKEVSNNTAKYLNINGYNNDKSLDTIELSSYINKNTTEVVDTLKNNNIDVTVLGNGSNIIKQYPLAGTHIVSYDKVILLTNDKSYKIPSLIGWSKKDASVLLDMLNVKYKINGTGYVIKQSVVDQEVNNTTEITLDLQDKYNLAENG